MSYESPKEPYPTTGLGKHCSRTLLKDTWRCCEKSIWEPYGGNIKECCKENKCWLVKVG